MGDPCRVRSGEGGRNLRAEKEHLLEGKGALFESTSERLARQQLHHQIVDLALLPHVEQGAHVRMCKSRDGLRLPPETSSPVV